MRNTGELKIIVSDATEYVSRNQKNSKFRIDFKWYESLVGVLR
jgi:hypothetical protein